MVSELVAVSTFRGDWGALNGVLVTVLVLLVHM